MSDDVHHIIAIMIIDIVCGAAGVGQYVSVPLGKALCYITSSTRSALRGQKLNGATRRRGADSQ